MILNNILFIQMDKFGNGIDEGVFELIWSGFLVYARPKNCEPLV